MDRIIARWLFNQGLPFGFMGNPQTQSFMRFLNPSYTCPNRNKVTFLLPDIYFEYRILVQQIFNSANELTVIFDASENIKNNCIINISVVVPQSGAFFYWDTFDTVSLRHTALTTIDLLKPRINEITNGDPKRVSAICTNTCAAMRKIYRDLANEEDYKECFMVLCISHGLQLLINDISQYEPWIYVYQKTNAIITFFRKAKLQLARLREIMAIQSDGTIYSFLTSVITRWGNQYTSICSVIRAKQTLVNWANNRKVLEDLHSKKIDSGTKSKLFEVANIINDYLSFWQPAFKLSAILQPIYETQIRFERNRAHVGTAFGCWEEVENIWRSLRVQPLYESINWEKLVAVLDKRKKLQTSDIHCAAQVLDIVRH